MPDVGRSAPDEEHTQSVCFWKDANWTKESSRKWCEDNGYKTDGFDENATTFRWRQYDPDSAKFDYRNKDIKAKSIFLVIGYPKSEGGKDMAMSTVSATFKVDGEAIKDGMQKLIDENVQLVTSRKYKAIRCHEGSAKPQEAFWRMRNALETGGEAEVEFYGPISEYVWTEEDSVTPKVFKDQLYKVGAGGPVRLRVNSPGGDMVAASVIRSILTDYPGRVTAQIDGIAASAAIAVVMAASETQILDTAFMVIHDPSATFFMAELNIQEMQFILNTLQSAKASIVDTYSAKTGLSNARLERMMTATTWMGAAEAVSLGFADKVLTGGNQKNAIKPNITNSLRQLGNVPLSLLNAMAETPEDEAKRRDLERYRGEVQFISKKEE